MSRGRCNINNFFSVTANQIYIDGFLREIRWVWCLQFCIKALLHWLHFSNPGAPWAFYTINGACSIGKGSWSVWKQKKSTVTWDMRFGKILTTDSTVNSNPTHFCTICTYWCCSKKQGYLDRTCNTTCSNLFRWWHTQYVCQCASYTASQSQLIICAYIELTICKQGLE